MKALPLVLRQVMQWHRPTRFGSPVARKVSPPQAQPPVRVVPMGDHRRHPLVWPAANWSIRWASSMSRRVSPWASWVDSVTSTLR